MHIFANLRLLPFLRSSLQMRCTNQICLFAKQPPKPFFRDFVTFNFGWDFILHLRGGNFHKKQNIFLVKIHTPFQIFMIGTRAAVVITKNFFFLKPHLYCLTQNYLNCSRKLWGFSGQIRFCVEKLVKKVQVFMKLHEKLEFIIFLINPLITKSLNTNLVFFFFCNFLQCIHIFLIRQFLWCYLLIYEFHLQSDKETSVTDQKSLVPYFYAKLRKKQFTDAQ